MRLLLDPSILIRIGTAPETIAPKIRRAVLEADSMLVTSVARAELCLKVSIGNLTLPTDEAFYWCEMTSRLQAQELPFACHHALRLVTMPLWQESLSAE